MTKQLLMGNEAIAYAALEAGVRVAAGYPGTPSSEIIETIARLHASGVAQGVHVEWSTNEKAALELLGGASLAGARCLFTCKQMGLNVASDPLMCLNYVGVRGGLVLIVADDPGPISSQTEQDTRRFAAFAKVPVLDPSTPEQAYEMVKAAFELSEQFGTPVIVRPTTRVDHASAFFDVPDQTQAREVPDEGFVRDPAQWVIFPKRSFEAHGTINARMPQMVQLFSAEEPWKSFNESYEAQAIVPEGVPAVAVETVAPPRRAGGRHAAHRASAPEVPATPACLFGIVAGGVSAAYAQEALRIIGERAEATGAALPAYRFMQVGTPYPFPTQAFWQFAEGLTDILVLEELDYVLEDELLRFAGRVHAPYAVHGKLTGETRDRGENDVDDTAARIAAFLDVPALGKPAAAEGAAETLAYEDDLPIRPPVLCPGCPHRGSFYAVKCALGSTPAVLCGDIGCYTLGNAKPLEAVDTCLCMGAGITMAQGIAVADPGKKAVAFVGDSTFFASGMPGLANAAYNGHDVTVVVLDNATTAMTGSQPHPGTGVTLMGPHRTPLSIEEVLRANGFTHIYRANPLDKDAALVAAKAAIAYEGPSAVIFESPCIQLIKPKKPLIVDTATCIGCKKCITQIGCPGLSFDAAAEGPKSGTRGQAVVDPAQCNGCGLCAQICPTRAIVREDDALSAFGAAAVSAIEAAVEAEAVQAGMPAMPAILEQAGNYREAAPEVEAEVEAEPEVDAEPEFEAESEPESATEEPIVSADEEEDALESETDEAPEDEAEAEPEPEPVDEAELEAEEESAPEVDAEEEPEEVAEEVEDAAEKAADDEAEEAPEAEDESAVEPEDEPEADPESVEETEETDSDEEPATEDAATEPEDEEDEVEAYFRERFGTADVEFPDDVKRETPKPAESDADADDAEPADAARAGEFPEDEELAELVDADAAADPAGRADADADAGEFDPFESTDAYFVDIDYGPDDNESGGQDWHAWKRGYPRG